MKKAIILMGPPGAGKGTQADLIADNLDFFHFDTGRYIARLIEKEKSRASIITGPPKTKGGKTELEQGLLTDPLWVLRIVKEETAKLAKANLSIIFSGSPRTLLEAFGTKKGLGMVPWLTKLYGKRNILVFKVNVSPQESLKRNSRRIICSLCRRGAITERKMRYCSFCGGNLIKRADDKPAIIRVRLKEYQERTEPVIRELKRKGFTIINVDGTPKPNVVFHNLEKKINDSAH